MDSTSDLRSQKLPSNDEILNNAIESWKLESGVEVRGTIEQFECSVILVKPSYGEKAVPYF